MSTPTTTYGSIVIIVMTIITIHFKPIRPVMSTNFAIAIISGSE